MFQHHPESRLVKWLLVLPLPLSLLARISGWCSTAPVTIMGYITPAPLSPAWPGPWCCGRSKMFASGWRNTAHTTTWPTWRPSPSTPSQVRLLKTARGWDWLKVKHNHGLCSLRLQAARCCGWTGRSWSGWGSCRKRYGRSCCSRCCSSRCRRRDATCSCSAGVTVRLLQFSLLIDRCFDLGTDWSLRVSLA